MREFVNQLLEAYQQSLQDRLLSQGEKQALRQLLDEAALNEEEKAYLRNRLFGLARDSMSPSDDTRRTLDVLDWLDSATKALYKPGGKSIQEAFFSPGDACVDAINGYLGAARSTLHICVFTITDDRITRRILQSHESGVDIQIITDNEKSLDHGSDISALAQAGVPVRMDVTPNHMHHKFAIIDEEIVLTGSYNWTRSAAGFNHENILVTNDADLVKRYLQCFHNLWPFMRAFTPP